MLGRLIPTGGGDEIPLLKPKLLVGRRDSCDICLQFSNISSRHCELEFINGYWQVTDLAITLFREEYKVPFLPPELAAHLGAYTELTMPIFLALGLLSRLAALPLLGMTAVIGVFVYPGAWDTHLTWAALLLLIVARGPGALSIDALIGLEPRRF